MSGDRKQSGRVVRLCTRTPGTVKYVRFGDAKIFIFNEMLQAFVPHELTTWRRLVFWGLFYWRYARTALLEIFKR